MKRKDKIKLLQDFAAGRKTIDEILPPKVRIWETDEKKPEVLHCKKEGITKRKGETLPDEMGREIINIILVRPSNIPPFA